MISQEEFDKIEMEKGCGYWYECTDRACPCAITMENKGLTKEIWEGFKEEQQDMLDSLEDFEYESIMICPKCGQEVEELDLDEDICDDCYWDRVMDEDWQNETTGEWGLEKSIFDYIEESFGIANFLEWIRSWQETQEWDFPNWIWKEVPDLYTDPFKVNLELYRGLYVDQECLISTGGCSWTSNKDVAIKFACNNPYERDIDERELIPKPILVTKFGVGISLQMMLDEFKKWLDMEDLENLFEENEYISDMDLKDCKIEIL